MWILFFVVRRCIRDWKKTARPVKRCTDAHGPATCKDRPQKAARPPTHHVGRQHPSTMATRHAHTTDAPTSRARRPTRAARRARGAREPCLATQGRGAKLSVGVRFLARNHHGVRFRSNASSASVAALHFPGDSPQVDQMHCGSRPFRLADSPGFELHFDVRLSSR